MKRPERRVAVARLGPITAVGTGVEELRLGLSQAKSPVRELTTFDASPFRSRMAAELGDFDQGRDQAVRAILSNSFGFGGIDAVLLLTEASGAR